MSAVKSVLSVERKWWWPPSSPNIESIRMSKGTAVRSTTLTIAVAIHEGKKTRLNEKSIKTENGVRRRRFVASLYQIVWNSEFRYVPLNEVKRNFKIKAKTFDKFERFLWIVKWHWYWCWYFLNRFVCICKISSCFVTTNFWIRDESICIIAVAVVVVVVHHRIHHCRRGLGLHHRLEEIVHRYLHRHRVHCPKHVH